MRHSNTLTRIRASASADPPEARREAQKAVFLEPFAFPRVPGPMRQLMDRAMANVCDAVGGDILPTRTPGDVREFQAPNGSTGFISLFPGRDRAQVDRVLVSWLHCCLPGGAALAFATLAVLMGPATDAPHLLLEFTLAGQQGAGEGGPMSVGKLIGVMDLMPRQDLVLRPDYLKRVYEDTGLCDTRDQMRKHPRLEPYEAPTPYVRALLSPAALCFSGSVESADATAEGQDGAAALVQIMEPAARHVAEAWAALASEGRPVPESERPAMKARDSRLFLHGIEADLVRNLPRIYGDDVTTRIVEAVRDP